MTTHEQITRLVDRYQGLPPARSVEESILIAQQLLVSQQQILRGGQH